MPEKNKIKHSKVVEAIIKSLLVLGVVLIVVDGAVMPDDEIWVGGIGLGLVLVILFYSIPSGT